MNGLLSADRWASIVRSRTMAATSVASTVRLGIPNSNGRKPRVSRPGNGQSGASATLGLVSWMGVADSRRARSLQVRKVGLEPTR